MYKCGEKNTIMGLIKGDYNAQKDGNMGKNRDHLKIIFYRK